MYAYERKGRYCDLCCNVFLEEVKASQSLV